MNEREALIKGGYYVEVVGSDRKTFLWGVVDDHVVEEGNDHDEIRLLGFGFNFFDEDEEGVGRKEVREYPHLLMLTNLWPGDWKNRLETMNMKVDEDNSKYVGMMNGQNIGCLVSDPTFGLGGSRLWDKEEKQKIIGRNSKRCSIRMKVDLYEVSLSYIIYCLFLFCEYNNTLLPPARFVVYISPRERS